MKHIIIARTKEQAETWRDRHNLTEEDTLIIDDPEVGAMFQRAITGREIVFINLPE